MEFFTDEQIESKFKSKKSSCVKRKISFEFTKEEFILFCKYLNIDNRCSYTGVVLRKETGSKHQATIERLDADKGYNLHNCVWVTKQSNQIKGSYDARNKAIKASFTVEQLRVLDLIFKSNVNDKLVKINNFVKGVNTEMQSNKEKNEISESNLQVKPMSKAHPHSGQEVENNNSESKANYVVNDDVNLATMYAEFAGHCKEYVDFLLSFNEYKRLMQKKQCQLSNMKFDGICKPSLFVLDKTKAVNVNNLLVVDLKLRHLLDTFIGKAKLDQKTLKKIFSNLGDKL